MRNSDFAPKQLTKVQYRINLAAKEANRDPSEITLIGACKQQSSELIGEFHNAGLDDFGENYLQEALEKRKTLSTIPNWHFIGRLQSNKCKDVAHHFSWVHTVDRLKIANALALAAEKSSSTLNILVQLNIDEEKPKGGVSVQSATELCSQISEMSNLRLRGFMLIPKPTKDLVEQHRPFALARETLESINQRYGLDLDTLSMGMSNDIEAAILEGSTMIRIGTDLFGPRTNDAKA